MILMRTLCDNRRVGVMLMLMLGVVLLFLMSLLHGSVNIPVALRPYMGGKEKVLPKK